MAIVDLIAHIDTEIAKLQEAKALLNGGSATAATATPVVKGKRGRPKGSKSSVKAVANKVAKPVAKTAVAQRIMSVEARRKIADVQP